MSRETTCPICHLEHVPLELDQCPQCDSDLTCFKILNSLPEVLEKPVETATTAEFNQIHKQNKKITSGLIVTTVILFSGLVFIGGYIFQNDSRFKTEIKNLTANVKRVEIGLNSIKQNRHLIENHINSGFFSIEKKMLLNFQEQGKILEKRIETIAETVIAETASAETAIAETAIAETVIGGTAGLKKKSPEMELLEKGTPKQEHIAKKIIEKKTPAPQVEQKEKPSNPIDQNSIKPICYKIYLANDDDTLWEIAEKLYDSGFLYPVLMKHNSNLGIYNIGDGTRVRYLCDKSRAAKIYGKIIHRQGGRFYLKYTVKPHDTAASIRKKYCSSEQGSDGWLKPGTHLVPGQQIKILLE